MIGQLIGNYEVLEKLSEGGMGAVYKAVDTMLHRQVAIKVLRPQLANQTNTVERFRLEAIALAKLNHPNIATLHSFFSQGNELFMILEFVRGETLDKVLEKRGALSCEEAIPIFSQVLAGIGHAHESGIIHRDIKPANIMLTDSGTLKVLDFGIARLLGSARVTRAGNIIGTLEYMAPEQVKGQETDARSDIYALGMTLYEVLTGKTPFDTENEFELIQNQIGEMPRNPREINPNIPKEVEAAMIKAYTKNPDERFQTAGEFREILLDAIYKTSGATNDISPSLPVKFEAESPQSHILQSLSPKESFQKTSEALTETSPEEFEIITKEIEIDSRFNVPITTSPASAGDIKEIFSGSRQPATTPVSHAADKSSIYPSFLSKLTRASYAGTSAAIFILFLFLVAPIIFFEDEKIYSLPANEKVSDSVIVPEEQPPLPAPADVQPAVNVPPAENERAQKAVPAPAAKKKVARDSDAVRLRLRRAEKILTGN